ncbi:methyltransferase family protein [Pseudaminobacter sp. NGMCC 1.201702]|uniref:methyltransferase family protein n=1 Tax=Pseudaminobacter sp. NGMCC 1.201702 TaxID=3391825 RepID=UPI0039F0AE98
MDAGYGNWTTLWPYAVLLSALGVWAVYHFLAPSSWRDWAGAGLVQAFIIALYAEMYGFPLTIYLLTSVLPLEIPLVHPSGHLWATLLGYGRLGAAVEMVLGFIFVVTGLLLIIKGWIKVYFSREKLVTDGVYGLVRHPQYLGIFLIVFGQLVHWPTIPTLALAPVIVWLYVRLAKREEVALIRGFEDRYLRYRDKVPKFVPNWQRLRGALI